MEEDKTVYIRWNEESDVKFYDSKEESCKQWGGVALFLIMVVALGFFVKVALIG